MANSPVDALIRLYEIKLIPWSPLIDFLEWWSLNFAQRYIFGGITLDIQAKNVWNLYTEKFVNCFDLIESMRSLDRKS